MTTEADTKVRRNVIGGIAYDKGGPDDGPELYPVSSKQLEKIEAWAVQHGY